MSTTQHAQTHAQPQAQPPAHAEANNPAPLEPIDEVVTLQTPPEAQAPAPTEPSPTPTPAPSPAPSKPQPQSQPPASVPTPPINPAMAQETETRTDMGPLHSLDSKTLHQAARGERRNLLTFLRARRALRAN